MAESIFITASGRSAKNKSSDVAKRIKDASSDISGAKKELNNVDYVNLSYEINQLETMYKKNNEQASQFETFANTLENMVNDYIDTDKNCATRIKANGRNHRKNTGLAKNLALATICASFDKIGDKLGGIVNDVKDWAKDVLDWIKKSFKEDWDSYLQFIEGGASLLVSIGTLAASIAAAATGAGLPLAIPMLLASLVTMYTSVDKIASSLLDIGNAYETDGSTVTKHVVDSKLFNFVYDTLDAISGRATGAGLSKLSNFTQSTEVFLLLGKGDFGAKGLKFMQNSEKLSNVVDYIKTGVEELQGLGELWKSVKDGNISDGLAKYGVGKLIDLLGGNKIEGKIDDEYGNIVENMIKNNKVAGVLG